MRVALLLGFMVYGCAAPTLSPADRRAIASNDSTYVAAWLRDDTSAVLATLTADAVMMPAGQHALDRQGVTAFWWPNDGSHTKILTFARVIDDIDGGGALAYVRGSDSLTYAYSTNGATQQMTSKSMTLAVVRRQPDGQWRIARMMWATRTP